jgi:hypothetical protein
LLSVLDRLEIPLNTNVAENDIRAFGPKRKITGDNFVTSRNHTRPQPRQANVVQEACDRMTRLLSGAERGFAIFHIIFSPIEAICLVWVTHRVTPTRGGPRRNPTPRPPTTENSNAHIR